MDWRALSVRTLKYKGPTFVGPARPTIIYRVVHFFNYIGMKLIMNLMIYRYCIKNWIFIRSIIMRESTHTTLIYRIVLIFNESGVKVLL